MQKRALRENCLFLACVLFFAVHGAWKPHVPILWSFCGHKGDRRYQHYVTECYQISTYDHINAISFCVCKLSHYIIAHPLSSDIKQLLFTSFYIFLSAINLAWLLPHVLGQHTHIDDLWGSALECKIRSWTIVYFL